MVKYNFKSIVTVPSAKEMVDIVLSRTQRKTPTQCHSRLPLPKIRAFYMRKVKFTSSGYHERLSKIVESFPKLDVIHPFYRDLIAVLYDKDHYKLALGQVNTARAMIDNVSSDYVKQLKYADSQFRCKCLKKAALGRMTSVMKKQKGSMEYLEQVRQHLSRLPTIDPSTRTLVLTGFPNVGKSSFINQVTRANVEVQNYAFTTRSLYVGHMDYNYNRYQVIDSPGVLDRPLEDRNVIEMQAITALAHLNCAVLFFLDISPDCKYPIADQVNLFKSLKPLYENKPVVLVVNKIDTRRPEDLPEADKAEIESLKKHVGNLVILPMSNKTEEGVMDVRGKACDMLLAFRLELKARAGNLEKVANRVFIAMPEKRDRKKRLPHYPPGVIDERKDEVRVRKRKRELDDLPNGGKLRGLATENEMEMDEPAKKKKRTLADIEKENGGPGVYQFSYRNHWILDNPVWKNDNIPEIYLGKNVADFYHPGIGRELKALEEEERKIEEQIGDSDSEAEPVLPGGLRPLTVDQKFLVREIRKRRGITKSIKDTKSSTNHPVLTRDRVTRTVEELTEHLQDRGLDPTTIEARASKLASEAAAVARDRMTRLMGDDEGVTTTSKQPMARDHSRRATLDRNKVAKGVQDLRTTKKTKKIAMHTLKKLRSKGRYKSDDRFIAGNEKHLKTGKRGIGKTDWR